MPASIPNDIYQYSLFGAFSQGLTSGGPPAAFLTRHGTQGIGTFANGRKMIMIDAQAWQLQGNGAEQARIWTPAPGDGMLPFVMVTCFEAVFQPKAPWNMALEEIEGEVLVPGGAGTETSGTGLFGWSKNDYLSVRIHGVFEHVRLIQDDETISMYDVKGTVFGFRTPDWAATTSPKGLHMHFISDEDEYGPRRGGVVEDFQMTGGTKIEFAPGARFHLGLPQGEQWETLNFA